MTNPLCSNALRKAGLAYPRTCKTCVLGPCTVPPPKDDTPTLDQVREWAREAQIAFCLGKYSSYELALVTRAYAEGKAAAKAAT